MTIAELKKAVESDKVSYGIKEVMKKGAKKVFITSDTRDSTKEKFKKEKIDFEQLNEDKLRVAKELKLNFLSEVYAVGLGKSSKKKTKASARKKTEKETTKKGKSNKTTKKGKSNKKTSKKAKKKKTSGTKSKSKSKKTKSKKKK